MNLTIRTLLLLLAVFVFTLSALVRPQQHVDLFKLGVALVVTAWLVPA
jgi:hypothetical protein